MGTETLRGARVRVPASTSNLGSGFDCLGLALDRHVTALYEPGGAELRLEYEGTLAHLSVPPERDLLAAAFRARMAAGGHPEPRGILRATSDIPIARGLGSSAAAVVAGIRLADIALRSRIDPDSSLAEAVRWERHADNAAPALLGGLTAVAEVRPGAYRPVRLPLSRRIGFAFAAPGAGVATARARKALPGSVEHPKAARALGRVVALTEGLATGDSELLRLGFRDELHVPYRMAWQPDAANAISAAREAGAWAATLSGSGSGVIAVSERDTAQAVADAMLAAVRAARPGHGAVAFTTRPELAGATGLGWSPREQPPGHRDFAAV